MNMKKYSSTSTRSNECVKTQEKDEILQNEPLDSKLKGMLQKVSCINADFENIQFRTDILNRDLKDLNVRTDSVSETFRDIRNDQSRIDVRLTEVRDGYRSMNEKIHQEINQTDTFIANAKMFLERLNIQKQPSMDTDEYDEYEYDEYEYDEYE